MAQDKALARDRARRYQQNRIAAGLCASCGKEPLAGARYGLKCLKKNRERLRKTGGARRRYRGSLSYAVEKADKIKTSTATAGEINGKVESSPTSGGARAHQGGPPGPL